MTFSQFISICLLFLGSVYGMLYTFPSLLFKHKTAAGPVIFHSLAPLHEFVGTTTERALAKLEASSFNDPDLKPEVYITGDNFRYRLLAPFCKEKFSCVDPLTGHIFVINADFEANKAYSRGGEEEPRALDSLLSHEFIKAHMRSKLGYRSYLSTRTPKTDGYADHLVMETAFLAQDAFCNPDPKFATLSRYQEDRLTIEQMKFERDASYFSLIRDNSDDKTAKAQLLKKVCGR